MLPSMALVFVPLLAAIPADAFQLTVQKEAPLSRNMIDPKDPDAVLGEPVEPGCYVRWPNGCRQHPMKSNSWRHDTAAEDERLTVDACRGRAAMWNEYCGIGDAQVQFVDGGQKDRVDKGSLQAISGEPAEPGCYVRMPTGCWNDPVEDTVWRFDAQAEQNEVACVARKHAWNSHCGIRDARSRWVSRAAAPQRARPQAQSPVPPAAATAAASELNIVDRTDPDAVLGTPVEPGCYMRMPNGCRNHPLKNNNWRHDLAAEESGGDEASCKARPARWNDYCGISDTRGMFVKGSPGTRSSSVEFKEPTEGDFMQAVEKADPDDAESSPLRPSRSELAEGDFLKAARDAGEGAKAQAGAPMDSGLTDRSATGPRNAQPVLVAKNVHGDAGAAAAVVGAVERPAATTGTGSASPATATGLVNVVHPDDPDAVVGEPVEPGCYMRMPDGCRHHPLKTNAWRHDLGAEEEGALNAAKCRARRAHWRIYCGTKNAQALFVSERKDAALRLAAKAKKKHTGNRRDPNARNHILGEPVEPGCYVRAPTGCPRHPVKSNNWRSESSATDEGTCTWYRSQWAAYCGAKDVEARFVASSAGQKHVSELQLQGSQAKPPADAVPSEPGCYVRMPTGCMQRAQITTLWRHDTWAEQQDVNESACKQRAEVWNRFCGTEDARSAFVAR